MTEAATEPRSSTAPSIELSEAAVARLKMLLETSDPPPVTGVRLRILGRTPQGFEHQLTLVDQGSEPAEDLVYEFDGLDLYVDGVNADYLDGIRVDWRFKGEGVNGFEFANPNPLWFDPLAMDIQRLFDESINPAIAAHGGHVTLMGIEEDTVYVQMGGGCQGCGMANATLKRGVETSIREFAPHIESVVDVTDHASGTNPYYAPASAGGHSHGHGHG